METREPQYIVGIAASAGGLEALTELVASLSSECKAAFVVAQHMSPKHKSHLPKLLARETRLSVQEISKATKPMSGVIYVGAPNHDISFEKGKLHLRNPSTNAAAPKPSADRLFKSLASGMGEKCVGVVLSGTGNDGSYGIRAIHEAGGITIAQDSSSAKYDGMPSGAIETGSIDLVLSPTEIAKSIDGILRNQSKLELQQFAHSNDTQLDILLQVLLVETGVDFRDYKETTLRRRIQRRMVALNMQSFADYTAYCKSSRSEIMALYKDLLISVTRFFRDPEQFAALTEQFERMLEEHDFSNGPIRIWVSGCATGEEAYSIAALVADAMGGIKQLSLRTVQIFATDLDEDAIAIARQGIYPSSSIDDIPDRLIHTMFDVKDDQIIVKRALRDVIYFSRHNIIQDPPFLNVQLITFRNVLIYFNARLQELVLGRLHYSLTETGVLFLGSSESIGPMQRGFKPISESHKIYQKRQLAFDASKGKRSALPQVTKHHSGQYQSKAHLKKPSRNLVELQETMFDALASSVAADAMLVSQTHEVLRVYGNVSEYIELSQDSRLDINLGLLKSPYKEDAINLCSYSIRKGRPSIGPKHEVEDGVGGTQNVWIESYPILLKQFDGNYALIAVKRQPVEKTEPSIATSEDGQQVISRLKTELSTTRDALQQSIEELQASNEELQMLNVQLQTSNEELQATNEEYETSNEELQSTNEELVTVNEEFH